MENGGQRKNQFEARFGFGDRLDWGNEIHELRGAWHRTHGGSQPCHGLDVQVPQCQTFSNLLGIVEIAIASLIALRPISPKLSSIGSAAAVVMFFTTLSFLFSTPGWELSLGGFPALSALPGQFLLKDVVLLGAAISTFAEAARNCNRRESPDDVTGCFLSADYERFPDQSPSTTEWAKE